jgi:murein DD-endopeptidase MepM/ murein hydrolase activator NlpD
VISLPVSGTWRVTQGHTCDTNHRRGHLGGEFAWDLAAVSEEGRTGTPGFDKSHRNDESATFGRPVTSPVAGTVASVVDGVDDNDAQKEFPRRSLIESVRAPRWIFGNHIVLDAGRGVFVLVAHLQKDSIVVKAGDAVRVGDVIARAGNSGNTMLPHVHVQVMDRADPADPSVSGIPALFRDYVEVSASGDGPRSEAVFRRMSTGDPPEGAFVLPAEAMRQAR